MKLLGKIDIQTSQELQKLDQVICLNSSVVSYVGVDLTVFGNAALCIFCCNTSKQNSVQNVYFFVAVRVAPDDIICGAYLNRDFAVNSLCAVVGNGIVGEIISGKYAGYVVVPYIVYRNKDDKTIKDAKAGAINTLIETAMKKP